MSDSDFAEKLSFLRLVRLASGDLPSKRDRWTDNCNFSIMKVDTMEESV